MPTYSPAARKQLEQTQEVIERLKNFARPYQSRWGALDAQLIGYSPKRLFPDKKTPRSNVSVPYPFANFDQVGAVIMESLFLTDPPFECLPRGRSDSDASLAMQRVLELLAMQKGRLRSVMNEFVIGLATYGFAALYVGWDWDYDTVPEKQILPQQYPDGSYVIDQMTGEPFLAPQIVRKKVPRNRPRFDAIDIYDLLIDPDGSYKARFFDKTLPQMLREQEMATAAGQKLYDDAALASLDYYFTQKKPEERGTALIRIAELWDAVDGTCTMVTTPPDQEALTYKDRRFANRSVGYSAWRRTVCDHEPVLLAPKYENPYLHCRVPIIHANYTKLPGQMFGFGVIEPVAGMVEHLNNMVRAIEDNWNMGVNTRYAYDMNQNADLEALQLANVPGGLVGVYGNVNDVLKELPTHTPDPGAYGILELFKVMIETGSGQSAFYSQGVGSPKGNETATGISSVMAQASKRLIRVVQGLEEDILEPLLQMTASNIQQFITDEIEVRATDENPAIPKIRPTLMQTPLGPIEMPAFITIAPEQLAGSFDFRLMGALYMENRVVQQANMLKLVEVIAGVPGFAAMIKPYPALQEIIRVFRIPYPGRFLKTEQEMVIEQAIMQEQQFQMAKRAQAEGLTPDERQPTGPPPKGGKKDANRQYAKPETNPATSGTRSNGQQTGLNSYGLGGTGLA